MADLDDMDLMTWLQKDTHLPLLSFLLDLEYHVYDEFNKYIKYPIVVYHFQRYSKLSFSGVDLKVKVFGMAHGVAPMTACTSFGDVCNFEFDQDTRTSWTKQLFFAIRCSLKKEYFDKFINIHDYLDSFKTF